MSRAKEQVCEKNFVAAFEYDPSAHVELLVGRRVPCLEIARGKIDC